MAEMSIECVRIGRLTGSTPMVPVIPVLQGTGNASLSTQGRRLRKGPREWKLSDWVMTIQPPKWAFNQEH